MISARSRLALLAAFAGVLLTAACGGAGGSSAKPTISAFSATPAILPLPGGPVTFHWTVKDASSLEIQPFIGAVTGSAKTVTLSSSNTFTLIAHNKNGASVATTSVLIGGPMTVAGTVRGQFGPLASVPVVVLGQPSTAVALTDTNGQFSIDGVVPPYDIAFVEASGSSPFTILYRGLTRPDPTLFDFLGITPPLSTTVAGTIAAGVGFPAASGVVTQYAGHTDLGGSFGNGNPDPTTGAWSLGVQWTGHTTASATVHAVEWHNAPHGPDAFLRFGSTTVSGLTNGVVVSGVGLPMAAVPSTAALSGDYVLAGGDILQNVHAGTMFTAGNTILDGESITYPGYTATTGSFSLSTPQIPNTHTALLFQTSGPDGNATMYFGRTGLVGNENNVKVTLPPAPQLLTPPVGGIMTHDTLFAWTAPAQSVALLFFVPNGGSGPGLAVVQAATTATIPSIPETGFDVIPGDSYGGGVLVAGPHATVDDAAGPGGLLSPAGTDAFVGIDAPFAVIVSNQP